MMRRTRSVGKRILSASILLAFVIAGFAVYMDANRRMTVSRNAKYVEDAANQTVSRIEDLLVGAENSIRAIAHLYGQTMNSDQPDIEVLQRMVDDTPFDYIGIVNPDGIYTDNHGRQAQVSDRFYFQDGMAGNSGMDIIFNGRVAQENLMIFYAPLWFDGEVVGVLTGRYGEKQMQKIISATFFEEPAATYLCLPDGTVFSNSDDSNAQDNILTALEKADGTDQRTLLSLEDALENGHSRSLTYTSGQGTNAAYVTKLPGKDWMLLQVFPIQVTNAMLNESNAIAMCLEIWLVLLFVAYILILLAESRRQKAQLVLEKQEMRDIVDSTTRLFNRFVLADLKNDSYAYLKSDFGDPDGAGPTDSEAAPSPKGSYTLLSDYWSNRIVQEDAAVQNQMTIASIQQNLTEDTPYLQYEYRVQADKVRWMQISVLCLKRERGIPVSILVAVQDVTELKEAELKNRQAMEEAYRSAKAANEAKTMFLSNMSHDMRTPMNAIIGFSALLDRDASQPDKVREYNGKIAASGRHLLDLINNVLEMSKIESGQNALDVAEFALPELLNELDTELQPQIQEKRQVLTLQVCDLKAERFLGDRLRLSQILQNLLSNAVKYTPAGGHITLSVLGLPEITGGYAHLCFEVRDDGIGISPEFLEHIFDPFTREKNTTASGILGTGLGMAITKNLVDLMGGTISVESAPGQGSTFRVELELRYGAPSSDAVHQAEPDTADPDSRGLEGMNVLVAEDNDINAEILEELLSIDGVSCERTVNGQEAVERFRQSPPGRYDAVLMDIQMPIMDGYEATRAIRALNHPDAATIPIVAMTANAFAEDVQRAMEAGMDVHLSKPIDIAVLTGVLQQLPRARRSSGEPAAEGGQK